MDVNFETYTPELLKAEMLQQISGVCETREGSYSNTLLSPAAYQLYKIYQLWPRILLMAFPDETAGEYIDLRARDFCLTRLPGTKAQVVLQFSTKMTSGSPVVPAGTVAVTEDGLRFVTLEDAVFEDQVAIVPAEAEGIGRMYNVDANSITGLAVNVRGVSAVTNPEEATGGTDDESDAAFYRRLQEHLQHPASSGNEYYYMKLAKEVSGVSYAAVESLWAGPGTAKVIIGGPGMEPVDDAVVESCAAHIEEWRIIGADITVVSVRALPVNVTAAITLAEGYTLEQVTGDLSRALTSELAKRPFGQATTLRHSTVLGLLLACAGCEGVENYNRVTLNGGTANVTAGADETLLVGSITITEV